MVALCAVLRTGPAMASQTFPAALQEAAGMPCTPACVVCHGKTPGDGGSFRARKLSRDLLDIKFILPNDTATLKANFATYRDNMLNAAAVAALKDGTDPETGDSLCGPIYGCAVQPVKRAPASESSGGIPWAIGAVVLGGLLRRRRQRSA